MKHALILMLALLIGGTALADSMAYDDRGNPIQALGLSTAQNVAYTAAAGTISNVVGAKDAGTVVAWVVCTTDCFIVTGAAPTATTSHTLLPGMTVMFIKLTGGVDKVSALRLNADGTLYVTLMD